MAGQLNQAAQDALASHPSDVAPRLLWLQGDHEPFLATLSPAPVPAEVAVLLLPPFGWEEMSSFRPRRMWAERFAAAGVPTLRIDLPGGGDAGGDPGSPDRVAAWVDAIAVAAAWLRAETGCGRIVAVGVSLGGLLALEAAARGAAIDDFVLWATPPRGRGFTRELRAFGRMEAGLLGPSDQAVFDVQLPTGAVAAGGYLLSAGTREALEALDVDQLKLAEPGRRAALLLERDGIAPAADLVAGLRRLGVDVRVEPGRGYGRMLVEPQFARLPEDVAVRTVAWVRQRAGAPAPTAQVGGVPVARQEAEVTAPDGTSLVERIVERAGPRGRIVGVLTARPGTGPHPVLAVLIGGTGHRIGPNRMWVEIARRWAARGIPCLRVDLAGAGDSGEHMPADVPGLYEPELVARVGSILQDIACDEGARQLLCVGLCASAYWALQASLSGEGVPVVPFMVNLPTLAWDHSFHADHAVARYRELLFRAETWRRIRRGEVKLSNAPRQLSYWLRDRLRACLRLPSGGRPPRPASEDVLDALEQRAVHPWFFFCGRELLHEQLERDGALADGNRWPGVRVDVVPGESDLHTLRPLWLQQRLHEHIDEALARQLARDSVA